MARRRRWIWIAVGTVTVLLLTVIALRRSPYAFLDRFQPTRSEGSLSDFVASYSSSSARTPTGQYELLLFKKDAPEILKAMEKELTPRRGFYRSGGDSSATWWEFSDMGKVSSAFMALGASGAGYFVKGDGVMQRIVTGLAGDEPFECAVLIIDKPSWFDNALDSARRFFRF